MQGNDSPQISQPCRCSTCLTRPLLAAGCALWAVISARHLARSLSLLDAACVPIHHNSSSPLHQHHQPFSLRSSKLSLLHSLTVIHFLHHDPVVVAPLLSAPIASLSLAHRPSPAHVLGLPLFCNIPRPATIVTIRLPSHSNIFLRRPTH